VDQAVRPGLQGLTFAGFTPGTGGLLREPDLLVRQAAFDRRTWLHALPLDTPIAPDERVMSLFCYEPQALPAVLQHLSQGQQKTRWLVTPGRPHQAVAHALAQLHLQPSGAGQLHISSLPHMSQTEFDHLLWACDLNFVRGEDSLVRALWAGQPFVWHIYPQDDLAHHDKLRAFGQALQMPEDLATFHLAWNGVSNAPLAQLTRMALEDWQVWSQQTQQLLFTQTDLTSQLLGFVAQKR
jgi:uncharacterized repeat protein (TIGR03837 family)